MRTWALSKVLDLFGNYYEISYSKSAHDSEVYPQCQSDSSASDRIYCGISDTCAGLGNCA
jgi:hypothetical protein